MATGTAGAQVLTALMYLMAAKGSAPAAFGGAVTAMALGTVTAGLLDFGTNSLWVREIAAGRQTVPELGSRYLSKVLFAGIVCAGWGATAFALGLDLVFAAAGAIAFTTGLVQASCVPLRAAQMGPTVGLVQITERLIAIALMWALWTLGTAPEIALVLALSAGALIASFLAIVVTPASERFNFKDVRLRNPWRGAAAFGSFSLAVSAQGLDVVFLGAVAGQSAAGIYGAVSRWTQPISLMVSAFTQAMVPIAARASSGLEAFRLVKSGLWILGLAIAGSLGVAFTAPWVVDLLLGASYAGSAAVLTLLAIGTIAAIVNQPLAGFLQARMVQKPVAVAVSVVVALQLGLTCWLGWSWGARGAATSSVLAQVTLTCVLSILARRFWHQGTTGSKATSDGA